MLSAVRDLRQRLAGAGIRYCHWKSNDRLAEAMAGEGDLDLLIDVAQQGAFEALMAECGYRLGSRPHWIHTPGTAHYYGFDDATGSLIHLHVYFQLITGGAILKNHKLPFATLALAHEEPGQPLPTPRKDIDLAVFVLRKMIEFGSVIEAAMVMREGPAVRRELAWLAEGGNLERAADLVAAEIPEVDRAFFLRCATTLLSGQSLPEKLSLGRQMARRLSRFAIRGPLPATALRAYRLGSRLVHKAFSRRRPSNLAAGGTVLAVVGPDATGKSTIAGALERWLAAEFWVVRAHAGRPPATWLTFIPQVVLPLLRRAAPSFRTSAITLESATEQRAKPLTGLRLWAWVVRALMIAHDRRALLRRLDRLRRQGAIVICDRYPSVEPGTMDSAQLPTRINSSTAGPLLCALAERERAIYEGLPPPSLILRLTVSVEVAIERNLHRLKPSKEGEDYLRQRHDQSRRPVYRAAAEIPIDTSGTLSATVLAAKAAAWRHLALPQTGSATGKTGQRFESGIQQHPDAALPCVQHPSGTQC